MKKLIVLVPILFISLVALSCRSEPTLEAPIIATPPGNPEDFGVQLIFTEDDCKVYRFYDEKKYHYFSKCEVGKLELVPEATEVEVYEQPTDPRFRY